jgi:hypothetical protein
VTALIWSHGPYMVLALSISYEVENV